MPAVAARAGAGRLPAAGGAEAASANRCTHWPLRSHASSCAVPHDARHDPAVSLPHPIGRAGAPC
jgi:hypothetical protein